MKELKTLKTMYEYLYDIYTNCRFEACYKNELAYTMDRVEDLYVARRKKLSNDECKIIIDGKTYYFGETPNVDYYTEDGEIYGRADLNYYWWY